MDAMASIQEMAELDLNDPLFKTDAFMVYGFKVLPCRRTRRHDWRECPFAHPGEVARRRDPRVYTYVGIICPDAKQNSPCPRGERCPYTHSLFEYWLHPTRYKTEFCSRGRQCTRPFCFFAHSETEMRPVDTEALLAVAMRPRMEPPPPVPKAISLPPTTTTSMKDVAAQTADLLQKTRFFARPPPLRTQSFNDSLHGRNGWLLPSDLRSFHSEGSASVISQAPPPQVTLASAWDTIYENSHVDALPPPETTHEDIARRYSMSDAVHASDVISKLGLGYLQQRANQRLLEQDAERIVLGDGVPTAMTSALEDLSLKEASFNSVLHDNVARNTKSLNSSLFPTAADAQLQAFLVERGHSLPTTLAQNRMDFH